MEVSSAIKSDTAPLNHLVRRMMETGAKIKMMTDPTRGGLATVLGEIALKWNIRIHLDENAIPVKKEVAAVCDLFGIDPLYVANEGKLVAVVSEKDADALIQVMKQDELGRDASIIGQVLPPGIAKVSMKTRIGGERIVSMPAGEALPRIC